MCPAMLILGGALGLFYIRRRAKAAPVAESRLSEQERARLKEILDK